MSDSRFYVYLYSRLDGTPCYVGKGCGERWKKHLRKKTSNPHLFCIIEQARSEGKELPVVKVAEGLTEDEAFSLERQLIREIGCETNGGPLVNLTDGGEGTSGWVGTPEFREKRKIYMTAFFAENPEARLAASLRSQGNKYNMNAVRTPEWCTRISASLLGNTRTKGHVQTLEHRANIGNGVRGTKQSPEWVAARIAKTVETKARRKAEKAQ